MAKKSKKNGPADPAATARANEELDQWILEHLVDADGDAVAPTEHDLLNEHSDTTLEAVRASLARLVAGGYVQLVDGAVELVRHAGDGASPSDAAAEDHSTTPTRSLKCVLTVDDMADKARQLDENFAELDAAERELDRLAREVKSAKGEIEALHGANARLARVRRDGYEYRDVACVERRNDEALTIETVRCDTGEVIETRPQSAQEKQGKLFDDAEPVAAQ